MLRVLQRVGQAVRRQIDVVRLTRKTRPRIEKSSTWKRSLGRSTSLISRVRGAVSRQRHQYVNRRRRRAGRYIDKNHRLAVLNVQPVSKLGHHVRTDAQERRDYELLSNIATNCPAGGDGALDSLDSLGGIKDVTTSTRMNSISSAVDGLLPSHWAGKEIRDNCDGLSEKDVQRLENRFSRLDAQLKRNSKRGKVNRTLHNVAGKGWQQVKKGFMSDQQARTAAGFKLETSADGAYQTLVDR